MTGAWLRRLLLVVAAGALVACGGEDPPTQVIVTIDADPEVKRMARVVDVQIYGGVRAAGALPGEGPQVQPFSVLTEDAWPVHVALAPKDGDANRLYRVIATARGAGDAYLAEVRAISGYVEGKTLWLRLYFDRSCIGVDPCEDPAQTCTDGECVDGRREANELPPWEEEADAGPPDGGGGTCGSNEECDDGVDCTRDLCEDTGCSHVPIDAECTVAEGGWCDPVDGCQYDVCDESTCAAGACQEATCDDADHCIRTSLCSTGEMCCGSVCVAAGCDDGDPCTLDTCGLEGCQNVAQPGASCDDGMYCNGEDTCDASGACVEHAGDPCPGASTCDESADACTGCVTADDCPAPSTRWDGCGGFTGTCDETGIEGGTRTTWTCESGLCVSAEMSDSRDCTRDTDTVECNVSMSYGTCTGAPCATTGTQPVFQTVSRCVSGTCTAGTPMMTDTRSCTLTPGSGCGSDGGTCTASETTCDDGIDEDCDGPMDCADPDCVGDPACSMDAGLGDGGFCEPTESVCNDGMDGDCDGPVDCADPDCFGDPSCFDAGFGDGGFCEPTESVCNDGMDGDCDGPMDCADPDCFGDPACWDGGFGPG